jgi:hypothetical protein
MRSEAVITTYAVEALRGLFVAACLGAALVALFTISTP